MYKFLITITYHFCAPYGIVMVTMRQITLPFVRNVWRKKECFLEHKSRRNLKESEYMKNSISHRSKGIYHKKEESL